MRHRTLLAWLLLGLLAGCGSLQQAASTTHPTLVRPTQAPRFPRVSAALPTIPGDDPRALGDPNAPVTIIEYSDFQCPFCQRHASQVFPELKARYIDTGKVRYVFRNYIAAQQHLAAPAAAVASLCAAQQDQFWPFHDKLFLSVEEWSFNPNTAPASFTSYANTLGMDEQTFNACQTDPATSAQAQAEVQTAVELGMNGTPGFLVGPYFVSGAQPLAIFDQAIALAQAEVK